MRARRENKEYAVCKAIATYLRLQYPSVLFHFDLAGLNLSRAQAGMTKALNSRGWPDLIICEPSKTGKYKALFIELKAIDTKLYNKSGEPKTDHLVEQTGIILRLESRGFYADFGVGLDACIRLIENYFNIL